METIWLQRPSGDIPWGFRLQGGREYEQPLSVQRVTPGSVAANGLSPGDIVLKIGNVNATDISHSDAQEVIRGASSILQLTIKKGAVVSAPVSPSSSAPQYSSSPQQPEYNFPDYKVGSGYSNGQSNMNSGGRNYAQEISPYDVRQSEQPPVSGYSTLPVRSSSSNKQNNESFRPVQQQNRYPYKSTTGIKLQMNPQNQNNSKNDYNQSSYDDRPNYSSSQPMSPVQYPYNNRSDPQYQRQTSVGSNRQDTNNYPQSHYKNPTPFSPTGYNNQNGSASPPPRLQRQTSNSNQGGNPNVYEATISPGFQPGSFLPKSDEAPPPPPPPPANYRQPEQYQRQPSYSQDSGPGQYQRQTSQPRGYAPPPPPPSQFDHRPSEYDPYQQRQQQPSGMYVDTSSPAPQYQRQGSNQYSAPSYQQQQAQGPGYYDDRHNKTGPPASFQRQMSGSQQQQPQQQYSAPYTPDQSYDRQQSFNRQQSREQNPPNVASSPQSGTGINSFEDILSPFEKFQNSNYCDKLFARSPGDTRTDMDSGVVSDFSDPSLSYQSQSSDTPRSNMSSNYSGYSPPQPHQGGYDDRGEAPQSQSLLRPAPPAPPPPPVTPPPPPPPPPPPSDWTPTQRRLPPRQDVDIGGEQRMPDKVLNTMLKQGGTQKPFSYVPTGLDLKKFKERARQRGQPRPVMPRGYDGPNLDVDDSPAEAQPAQSAKRAPAAGVPNPETGVYKHAQYNSPLRMYSSDSAKEQFDIQSGGQVDVAGVNSTPDRRESDIKESEVYKMIQQADAQGKDIPVTVLENEDKQSLEQLQEWIVSPQPASRSQGLSFRVLQWLTDTVDEDNVGELECYKPKKPRNPLLRHNSEDDEMRFSGLHTKADIPSKAFQRLNRLAISDNDNAPGQEQQADSGQNNNEEPERIGNYDEASIRYRGNYIPSPSFRLLQSLAKDEDQNNRPASAGGKGATDDEDDGLPDKLNEEDMIDKRYTGANIPSRSFKALQMYMDDDKKDANDAADTHGPKIKVISRAKSPQTLPKPSRATAPAPVPQKVEVDNPSTDF